MGPEGSVVGLADITDNYGYIPNPKRYCLGGGERVVTHLLVNLVAKCRLCG